jgi:hypothetical protein
MWCQGFELCFPYVVSFYDGGTMAKLDVDGIPFITGVFG